MQGSAIAGVDVGGATIKLGEDGSYTLSLGATDMGTGCDTSFPDGGRCNWKRNLTILWSLVWIRIFLLMTPVLTLLPQPMSLEWQLQMPAKN